MLKSVFVHLKGKENMFLSIFNNTTSGYQTFFAWLKSEVIF